MSTGDIRCSFDFTSATCRPTHTSCSLASTEPMYRGNRSSLSTWMTSAVRALISVTTCGLAACRRTTSIHSAPTIPAAVPPATSIAVRTATYPGWVKLSVVSESNTGPAKAGNCNAALRASRCGHSVGSLGSGIDTLGAAAVWAPRGRRSADTEPPLAALPASSRTRASTWATSSQPTQPAS
ncbi:Uncharacterised protein [Mycobacteroides abscessus subsp. abscessus]|nr:Uncharacterised protein [Mycobacteroides abscessus subsp. abscessus]